MLQLPGVEARVEHEERRGDVLLHDGGKEAAWPRPRLAVSHALVAQGTTLRGGGDVVNINKAAAGDVRVSSRRLADTREERN